MDENGSSISWPQAWDYGNEKLSMATFYLATGSDTLEERLEHAAVGALIRIRPEVNLPPDLRERFEDVLGELRGSKAGPIKDTIAEMDDSNRQSIAERILELDRDMRELHSRYVEIPRKSR